MDKLYQQSLAKPMKALWKITSACEIGYLYPYYATPSSVGFGKLTMTPLLPMLDKPFGKELATITSKPL